MFKLIYSMNIHTFEYQFERPVIDHYERISLYTKSFFTEIRLHVYHSYGPRSVFSKKLNFTHLVIGAAVWIYLQGVQEKLCFWIINCNPSLTYILLQVIFTYLNAMWVYSHSCWLANLANFCTNKSSPVLARERWQNNDNSWQEKKKHNCSRTLTLTKSWIFVKRN